MSTFTCTIRYASGAVEHRYGVTLPKVGDSIGRSRDRGFVTAVNLDERSHATVIVVPVLLRA